MLLCTRASLSTVSWRRFGRMMRAFVVWTSSTGGPDGHVVWRLLLLAHDGLAGNDRLQGHPAIRSTRTRHSMDAAANPSVRDPHCRRHPRCAHMLVHEFARRHAYAVTCTSSIALEYGVREPFNPAVSFWY